jgi:hypothetical protein
MRAVCRIFSRIFPEPSLKKEEKMEEEAPLWSHVLLHSPFSDMAQLDFDRGEEKDGNYYPTPFFAAAGLAQSRESTQMERTLSNLDDLTRMKFLSEASNEVNFLGEANFFGETSNEASNETSNEISNETSKDATFLGADPDKYYYYPTPFFAVAKLAHACESTRFMDDFSCKPTMMQKSKRTMNLADCCM